MKLFNGSSVQKQASRQGIKTERISNGLFYKLTHIRHPKQGYQRLTNKGTLSDKSMRQPTQAPINQDKPLINQSNAMRLLHITHLSTLLKTSLNCMRNHNKVSAIPNNYGNSINTNPINHQDAEQTKIQSRFKQADPTPDAKPNIPKFATHNLPKELKPKPEIDEVNKPIPPIRKQHLIVPQSKTPLESLHQTRTAPLRTIVKAAERELEQLALNLEKTALEAATLKIKAGKPWKHAAQDLILSAVKEQNRVLKKIGKKYNVPESALLEIGGIKKSIATFGQRMMGKYKENKELLRQAFDDV